MFYESKQLFMRGIILFVFLVNLSLSSLSLADSERVKNVELTSRQFLDISLEEIRHATHLAIHEMPAADWKNVAERIVQLPELATLEFHASDLSKVDSNDCIPLNVNDVEIAEGPTSQGTIDWLAKFPKGVGLTILGCDSHDLSLNFGNFKWVTIDTCKISSGSLMPLIRHTMSITFKELKVVD